MGVFRCLRNIRNIFSKYLLWIQNRWNFVVMDRKHPTTILAAFFNCILSFIDLLLHWVAFTSETFLSLPFPGMYQRGSLLKMTANLKWNRILVHTIKVRSRSKEREYKSGRSGETESLPFFSCAFLVSKSPNWLFFFFDKSWFFYRPLTFHCKDFDPVKGGIV